MSYLGLGQNDNIITKLSKIDAVKTVRETVSPWLWFMSIAGFIMALINTHRIKQMYRKHQRSS